MTEQPTLTWHYLPELPPEPPPLRTERYLVASGVAVHEGWYEGNSRWSLWTGGKVHAWAEWPEAPPMRDER